MILQQWWLISVLEALSCYNVIVKWQVSRRVSSSSPLKIISVSSVDHISCQDLPQKRRCFFQVTPQNSNYTTAGSVQGSVQVCEKTHCCVGYFLVINGQPEVDLLACDIAEKSCPDETCKIQTRFNSHIIKCVCNSDLCNNNTTWTPDSEQPRLTYSYSPAATVIIVIGTGLALCLMIAAAKWRTVIKEKKENLQTCSRDYSVSPLCSGQTTKTLESEIADVELQRILGRGYFATVWQGKYQGSTVAVKVFPADWKHKFTAEKEVYELPLMKHAGIVHFLGSGRKPDDSSWLLVLQFAEYGSLHSFLCKHSNSWMLSLKLCQSLSQGLSYLHSDLRRYDAHKPSVAHRDLSSSNVLVRADGNCVLCDFGCSTILHQSRATNAEGHPQLGTLRYMSPEILEGSANLRNSLYLLQADMYALGLLLWEIWMRCSDLFQGSIVPQHLLPYERELGGNVTLESLIMCVCNMDKRPSIPKHWGLLPQGSALQDLLTECWDSDPDARLSAQCVVDRLVSPEF